MTCRSVSGQRLASLTAGIKKDHYGEQKITFKSIVSSNVLRAQQVPLRRAAGLGLCRAAGQRPVG